MFRSRKKSFLLALVAYAVVGFALFGPFFNNPFLMDDEIQVTHNAYIQNIANWPDYFSSSTMDSGGTAKMGGIYYKPLMTTYFATIWNFFGEDPAAFRVPLLCMHLFSAALIFLFLLSFSEWPVAFMAGLVFVIHPVNSEIVAYVADAQDALYLFFGLLSLTAFLNIKRGWLAALALSILLMASILSKETGALFFAIVPMAAFYFERRRFRLSLAVAAGVAVVYAFLRIHSGLLTFEHRALLIQRASYVERLQTIPLILWHYIEIFFFPLRISLVADLVVRTFSLEQFWLPLVGLVIFFATLRFLWTTLKLEREQKLFEFSIGILVLWFALHGSILVPLDGTYADRWFYLGTWALLMLGSLAVRKVNVKVLAAILGICCIALSARTWVRLQDWQIPLNLYTWELDQRPDDAVMANDVGYEYFHRGEIRKAEAYFERATKNNPAWDVAWNNLGACAQHLGELDRALGLYEKSVSLGSYYLAYENYASLLCSIRVDANCREFLKKAMTAFPRNEKLRQLENQLPR